MRKIVLAITGASGALYAKSFVGHVMKCDDVHLDVVASSNGMRIFRDELEIDLKEFWPKICDNHNYDVPFVSGSSCYDAMILMPCSMGMMGRVAQGISDDVITRTADVCLKEKRQLIFVPRETSLNQIHLENMLKLAQQGAHIIPAMPSFYSKPKTIEEVANTVVARVLDRLDIQQQLMNPWSM